LLIQFSDLEAVNLSVNSKVPSMVVIDDPKKEFYFDAIASFKVIKTLGFVVGIIASATTLFAKFIMSYFYRLIAKNRH
jgi:hypothetical protein